MSKTKRECLHWGYAIENAKSFINFLRELDFSDVTARIYGENRYRNIFVCDFLMYASVFRNTLNIKLEAEFNHR